MSKPIEGSSPPKFFTPIFDPNRTSESSTDEEEASNPASLTPPPSYALVTSFAQNLLTQTPMDGGEKETLGSKETTVLPEDEFEDLRKLISEANKLSSPYPGEGEEEVQQLLPLRRTKSYVKKKPQVKFADEHTQELQSPPPLIRSYSEKHMIEEKKRTSSDAWDYSAPISNVDPSISLKEEEDATTVPSQATGSLTLISSVSTFALRGELSYLMQMETMLFFNEKTAEKELSACLYRYPNEIDKIVDILFEIRLKLSAKRAHRLRETLTLALFRVKNGVLLQAFFNKASGDIDKFAAYAVKEMVKKVHHVEIISILSAITHCDVAMDNSETLFRETCLSSSLCKEYGNYLWKKELKFLCEDVHKKLKTSNLASICLNRNLVLQILKQTSYLNIDNLKENELNQVIDQEMEKRAAALMQFVHPILENIYAMKISPEFSELLQMRRFHVIQFLEKLKMEDKSTDLSRTYVSELFFLRMLNSHLTAIDTSPIAQSVLVSLAKVIQCLANQAPFGTEKKEPTYERLNPLYEKFIKTHCHFLDLHSDPRKKFPEK